MKYPNLRFSFVLACLILGIVSDSRANDVEQKFMAAGLIDVNSVNTTIRVDLVHSDPKKNYFREDFYNGLNRAYLQKEVAVKLSHAQTILQSKDEGLSLQILDAARPRSVSRKMYEKMKGTKFEKYVANSEKGSMHNYGIAVDVTILDKTGNELDMGFSPFRKSTLEIYWQFAKMKLGFKPTDKQMKNRQLLSETMKSAGFIPLAYEWWHFDGMPKDEARKRFKIIE